MTSTAFANPAHDSARAFRPMLEAVARPGRVFPFEPEIEPPPGLSRELAAVALTLCDFLTPIWLSPTLWTADIERYLRFHTGAPLTTELAGTSYAFAAAEYDLPEFSRLPRGTHEYPDRSATLVIGVGALNEGQGVAELSGPGIKMPCKLDAPPLGPMFWADLMELRDDYPLGVDVLLTAPGAIAAVPRSTDIAIRLAT